MLACLTPKLAAAGLVAVLAFVVGGALTIGTAISATLASELKLLWGAVVRMATDVVNHMNHRGAPIGRAEPLHIMNDATKKRNAIADEKDTVATDMADATDITVVTFGTTTHLTEMSH